VKCANCGDPLGRECVEGGYCSEVCRGAAEHEQRLRENEFMTLRVHGLDDGGVTVQINLRTVHGAREMVRRYDNSPAALRGIAQICTTVADEMSKEDEE